MKIEGNLPIAKFAAELPGAISIFELLGLDYACAGDRSLEDAAHAEGIAPEIVIAGLRRLKTREQTESWNDRPLSDLTGHLSEQHHRFVRDELARIAVALAGICSAPAAVPSYLISLRAAFTRLSAIVLPHLHREEDEAFLVIEALEKAWQSAQPDSVPSRGLGDILRRLADEHGAIAAQLRTIRELRIRLEDSDSLSQQCGALLDDLASLEAHLHEYMFLENCILFPRAAALAEESEVRVRENALAHSG